MKDAVPLMVWRLCVLPCPAESPLFSSPNVLCPVLHFQIRTFSVDGALYFKLIRGTKYLRKVSA